MRLGIVAYVVPFVFVFLPALIAKGAPGETISAVLTASVAVILLGIACAGYLFRPLSWWKRGWATAAAALLILPPGTGISPVVADAIGFALGVALVLWERRARSVTTSATVPARPT
jgi:TRAP-type uncharacterized transport system fused permease subunit